VLLGVTLLAIVAKGVGALEFGRHRLAEAAWNNVVACVQRTISFGVQFLKAAFAKAVFALNAVTTCYYATFYAVELLVNVGPDVFTGILYSALLNVSSDLGFCALVLHDFTTPFHFLCVQFIFDVPLLRKSLKESFDDSDHERFCVVTFQGHTKDFSHLRNVLWRNERMLVLHICL
jgi:hypothetical protein